LGCEGLETLIARHRNAGNFDLTCAFATVFAHFWIVFAEVTMVEKGEPDIRIVPLSLLIYIFVQLDIVSLFSFLNYSKRNLKVDSSCSIRWCRQAKNYEGWAQPSQGRHEMFKMSSMG
jgi:hypothetical protein